MEGREHWDRIYGSRSPDNVSWYEPVPVTSRTLIAGSVEEGAESVIDIGGGASTLVDHVLDLGVKHVAVLDISEAGLAVSKRRLGSRARLGETPCLGSRPAPRGWRGCMAVGFPSGAGLRAPQRSVMACRITPESIG